MSINEPLDDYHWLVSQAAKPWLALAADGGSLTQLTARLRKELSPNQVHLVLQQIELRHRARQRLALASSMFFTSVGLEQATDTVVARYKAGRFSAGQLVADLCCGIGGDLLELARRGPVTGVDRDPASAVLAAANLSQYSDRTGSHVLTSSVEELDLSNFAAWHIDPDRRPQGRRTTHIDLHEPGPAVLAKLLQQCPHAAIKLAPAAGFDGEIAESSSSVPWHEAELQWISRGGQCRQLVAWFGNLAQHPGQRVATRLELTVPDIATAGEPGNEIIVTSFAGTPMQDPLSTAPLQTFLHEPDPALLASHLAEAHAVELGIAPLAPDVAYYTGDTALDHRLWSSFAILETMPYKPKLLKPWLRERGIGRLEVKKRGVDLEPEKVRRELTVSGDQSATLLLCRVEGRITAIIGQRVAVNKS
ncbi:MAG: hypothetical protein SGJ20_10715 [Planctomycetota bacterium]|nr:hypothetical protein [Planctomycetota bacterium]